MHVSFARFVKLALPLLVFHSDAIPQSKQSDFPEVGQAPTPLVEAYFQTDNAVQRGRLADEIENACGGSIDAVAQAVRNAYLWTPISQGDGILSFSVTSEKTIRLAYRLAPHYDPLRRWPVILATSEGACAQTLENLANQLDDLADRFILVCPDRWPGGVFHQTPGAASDFRSLVRLIRRTFHTDTDRLYLYGSGVAGDAVWLTAIMHPILFAGVVVSGSYPKVPYAEHIYPIILPNLAKLPVLTVWERSISQSLPERSRAVMDHNRAIVAFARRAELRSPQVLPIEGIEIPLEAPQSVIPPRDVLHKFLSRPRLPETNEVSHWFRYPAQGRAGWLRQTKFLGKVWESDQLSLLPGPSVDHDIFTGDVIRDHLAYLGGTREGNIYRIETQKCAIVTLSLPLESVSPAHPVFVYCNGKRRHDDPINPNVRTLLAHAYRTWDVQHLIGAELSFSIRRDDH